MVDCQKQTTLTVNIQLEPGLGIALNQSVDHPEDWPIKNCSWHILYGSTLYIMPTIKVMECFLKYKQMSYCFWYGPKGVIHGSVYNLSL
jgi:hypothetical protein